MVDLELDHLEIDEIWTFCRKKRGRLKGQEQFNPIISGN